MELAEVVMNPARQRIFQYLLVHDTATVKALRAALLRISAAFAKYFAHEHGDPSAQTGQEGKPPKNREKEEEKS